MIKHNFVEELRWRGMLHDAMPGTEEQLMKEMTSGYLGIDPTADSLHVGHLVGVMMLKHLQVAGHKPIALVGGATGMIGDPSGKSQERNLLDEATLAHNVACLKAQLARFLDFDSNQPNAAELVNNYDWMRDFSFLEFIRDIGKHITVNYMMSKDSVKKRLGEEAKQGMSFTEFTYQLVQGYDFLHLYRHKNCRLQMGGSDQWGNITTGTELIRRKDSGTAFALTCPLMTKADGTKFGKTESGNVWLSAELTSPYHFYQFWLNVSDADAERYIRIFTMLGREEIDSLIAAQRAEPHTRVLQKRLALEVTVMVHGQNEYDKAVDATQILFGKGSSEQIATIERAMLLAIFKDVLYPVSRQTLAEASVVDLLSVHAAIFENKSEVRRLIQGNGLAINKNKITDANMQSSTLLLINDEFLLIQKGKKDYFIIQVQ